MARQDVAVDRKGGLLTRRVSLWKIAIDNSMLVVLVLFVIFATLISEGKFIRSSNLSTILFQSSVIGVLAIGQALVMISGGIDLAQATVLILVGTLMGAAGSSRQQDLSLGGVVPYLGLERAVLLGMGTALLIGLINGLIVVVTRIPPFITTLVTSLVVSGATLLITGGAPIYYPHQFFIDFGQHKLWGLPYPVYAWFLLTLLFAIFLSRSKYGAMLYALGGNERAAWLSGLPIARVKVLVYTLSGVLSGVAGFLYLCRTGYVTPVLNDNYLLATIAAVVVGGVSMAGGHGSIRHAFFGVLIFASMSNLMNILLISPYIQDAVAGAIIILAVMLNVRMARD